MDDDNKLIGGFDENSIPAGEHKNEVVDIEYGEPYEYSSDPGCCEQFAYHYEVVFRKK